MQNNACGHDGDPSTSNKNDLYLYINHLFFFRQKHKTDQSKLNGARVTEMCVRIGLLVIFPD